MFRVDKITRYQVRNDKNYLLVADDLADEVVAHKMATALNEQEIKANLELKRKEDEIESLKQTQSTSV